MRDGDAKVKKPQASIEKTSVVCLKKWMNKNKRLFYILKYAMQISPVSELNMRLENHRNPSERPHF